MTDSMGGCSHSPQRWGENKRGFQRWRCSLCGHCWCDDPEIRKAGRKPLGEKAMSSTERSRKRREK
jgi:hypothetical protein